MDKQRKIPSMLSVIKWEVRARRWSILWWIVGVSAFISITMFVYPSFRNQAAQYNEMFKSIPASTRNLLSDTGDFMSPSGYLSSEIFYLMLPMLFSFLCVGLGSSLIAREEQSKTIELLLSRPISRGKLLMGKATAGLVVALSVGLAVGIIGSIEVAVVKFAGISTVGVMLATMFSLLMCLLFGAIAFALTAMGAFGRGASIGIASLVAVAGYVISSLDKTVTWLQTPAKLFPYHYYKPAQFLEGHYNFGPALAFSAIIGALLLLSYVSFRRRDIE